MNKHIKVLFFILISNLIYAQDSSEKLELNKAIELEKNGSYTEAISLRKSLLEKHKNSKLDWVFENKAILYKLMSLVEDDENTILELATKSVEIYSKVKQKDSLIYYNLLSNLSIEQYYSGNYQESIKTSQLSLKFKKNFEVLDEKIEIYERIGSSYNLMGDKVNAIKYYKYIAELNTKKEGNLSERVAENYITIASHYSNLNNFNEQLKYMKLAENIFLKNPPSVKFNQFNLHYFFVVSYFYYGDMDLSKKYLDLLNQFYEKNKTDVTFLNHKSFEENQINEVIFIKVTANILYHKRGENNVLISNLFDEFIRSLPKDLENLSFEDILNINDVYLQTAIYFMNAGENFSMGIKLLDQAIELNEKLDFREGIINLNYHKGFRLGSINNWAEAKKSFENCIKFKEVDNYFDKISLYNALSKSYYYTNQSQKAKKYLDYVFDYYHSDSNQHIGTTSIRNLFEIGSIYLDIYKKNKKTKTLERAYNAYKKSSNIFSQVYQGGLFNDNLSYMQIEINKGLLFCAMEMGEKKGEVLELIEKKQSDFLWMNFLKNQKSEYLKQPLAYRDSIRLLNNKIEGLKNESSVALEKGNKMSFEMIQELEQKKERFENALKKNHQNFYNFSFNTLQIKDFQKKCNPNEIVLKYIVVDTATYAYKITSNSIDLIDLKVDANQLNKEISTYAKALKNSKKDFYKESQRLYNVLIAPLNLPIQKSLIIVSDNYLNNLPFETLFDGSKFLVSTHTISYTNSIKLFEIQNSVRNNNTKFVAFSPKYSIDSNQSNENIKLPTRSGTYDLEGAQKEANEIAKMFKGEIFENDKATKENFIKNSSDFSIIHLAMHGIVDDTDDNLSNLLFYNRQKLYLNELYNLHIPADLMVLSACNTGAGSFKNGEGIQSLSRALTYAGVKSSVYSLWEVPDKETSEIMIDFYKNLNQGMSKTESLALAKRNFIKNNPMKNHPYFWAGFVLNGNNDAIYQSTTWMYYLAAGFILIFLFIYFIWRKKSLQLKK